MKTKEERDELKQTRRDEKAERAFRASPVGRARTATENGSRLFELRLPDELQHNVAETLEGIEDEGWRLEHAGWASYIASHEKTIGHENRTHVVGVYLFRATAS